MPVRTPEFEERHRVSAKIAQTVLLTQRLLLQGYNHNKNVVTIWPEMTVIMVVRLNDHRRKKPISKNKIAKQTGLPRRTVDRYVGSLIRHRVIMEQDGGYIGDDSYMQKRADAVYFKRVVRVLRTIGHLLEDYK